MMVSVYLREPFLQNDQSQYQSAQSLLCCLQQRYILFIVVIRRIICNAALAVFCIIKGIPAAPREQ